MTDKYVEAGTFTSSDLVLEVDRSSGDLSKAADKLTNDLDQHLAFYDYPADHWVDLKTSNPIESTFATVRQCTKVTKGPGSRAAGLAMAYSSSAPPTAGAESTHAISLRSSEPAQHSRKENSSPPPRTR